jgi:hypothetical protein
MDVTLSKEEVDAQKCDVLVTGIFQDERPLKGSSGWMDWRFNGRLSRFLITQKLTGEWKETTLILSQGRIVPRMLLLIGLGKARDYSFLRIRELSPYLLETLRKLNLSDVCLSFPYEESYHVDCGKLAEVLLEGIADSIDLCQDASLINWTKKLRLFFGEGEERFYELYLGVQTATLILRDRLKMKLFVPSEITHEAIPCE